MYVISLHLDICRKWTEIIPLKFLKFILQYFLISNFRHVVFFLLAEFPASKFYGTQNSDAEESPKRKNKISFCLSRQTDYEYIHKLQ
jgi:hypothetical protein